LPPIALRPDRPLRAVEPDFMSLPVLEEPDIVPEEPDVLLDVSVDDPAPLPELVAGEEPVLVLADGELPLLDGLDVLLLPLVLGLLPLPPPVLGLPLLTPAPDDDPLAAPLPELPALPDPLWANAGVASIAPATVSASALIHVFITVLLVL
jgi:hypothetical protein